MRNALLSSLRTVYVQNQITVSINTQENRTLFFSPSPHELARYDDDAYSGDEAEKPYEYTVRPRKVRNRMGAVISIIS